MGKKVGSVFISIFLTIVIGVLSIFVGSMMEEEGFWEEVEIDDIDLREFMSENEFKEELGEFVSDYVKYSLGLEGAEKPSIKEIRSLLDEYIHDYASENNIDVDYDELNQYLDEMEQELEEELELEKATIDEDVEMVVNIGIILFLIGIDLLIRKDFILLSLHVGIPLIINGVASFGLGLLLGSFTTSNGEDVGIFDSLINIANRLGLYYLIPGIILIVLFIVFKNKIKKDPNVNNMNNPNNYNGYNNYNYNNYNYNNGYNNYNNYNN